jgi:hypothetical protein
VRAFLFFCVGVLVGGNQSQTNVLATINLTIGRHRFGSSTGMHERTPTKKKSLGGEKEGEGFPYICCESQVVGLHRGNEKKQSSPKLFSQRKQTSPIKLTSKLTQLNNQHSTSARGVMRDQTMVRVRRRRRKR